MIPWGSLRLAPIRVVNVATIVAINDRVFACDSIRVLFMYVGGAWGRSLGDWQLSRVLI